MTHQRKLLYNKRSKAYKILAYKLYNFDVRYKRLKGNDKKILKCRPVPIMYILQDVCNVVEIDIVLQVLM
jgi:hypothetical protein